jgi:hypothetical protein
MDGEEDSKRTFVSPEKKKKPKMFSESIKATATTIHKNPIDGKEVKQRTENRRKSSTTTTQVYEIIHFYSSSLDFELSVLLLFRVMRFYFKLIHTQKHVQHQRSMSMDNCLKL